MRLIFPLRNVFILLFLFTAQVSASQFANPYQGNIAVDDQSENELKQLALKQVLVKVSGNAKIAELDESKLLLGRIDNLLSQYGYQVLQNTRYFTAVFDNLKINQGLQDIQQPIWGETRPVTLLWLVSDIDGGRQFISDNMSAGNSDSQILPVLQEQQHSRGINLQLPIMDLEDNLSLSTSDVLGRFYGPITDASKRYGVEHVVVANLKQTGTEKWSLQWELIKSDLSGKLNQVLISDRLSGEKLSLFSTMVGDIADYYASQYAILENQGEKFSQTIYVNGISSLAQLTKLNNMLENLVAVASFAITSVQGSQVQVDIKISGGVNSFKNGLSAQKNLQPDFSQGEEFHFNWR